MSDTQRKTEWGPRCRECDLRERLVERLADALDALERNEQEENTEKSADTISLLASALSASSLEDIANTLRVIAYGPESLRLVQD